MTVFGSSSKLRVAAIDFLNPAPLMWDFEHPPACTQLLERYSLHATQPSRCAADLLAGRAELGLIPIAALTPELAIVPGCVIASLHEVRSIQLIVKQPHTLATLRSVAADSASLSSLAYTKVLLRKYHGADPAFFSSPAGPIAMLEQADAALLIGDPALLALEARSAIEQIAGPCQWFDIAKEWNHHTQLPWVAAVWAVREEAALAKGFTAAQIATDLQQSRDHGLANIPTLVEEWTPRIALPPATIQTYLTRNIHYTLTPACQQTIELFRKEAANLNILPPLGPLRFL